MNDHALVWIAFIFGLAPTTHPVGPDRNDAVIAAARSFPDGGGYRTDFGGTGSPVEIKLGDAVILKKGEGGTYCNGLTFATVMKVLGEEDALATKTAADVKAFQKTWYGTTAATAEKQCALAVVQLGVGREVTADEAKPGDFVQLWRDNKSGHSAVFLGWVEDNGTRVGLRYRSSQKSTDGIGDKSENFTGHGGKVIETRVYFARLTVD